MSDSYISKLIASFDPNAPYPAGRFGVCKWTRDSELFRTTDSERTVERMLLASLDDCETLRRLCDVRLFQRMAPDAPWVEIPLKREWLKSEQRPHKLIDFYDDTHGGQQ